MTEPVINIMHNLDSTYSYSIPKQIFLEGIFREGMTYSRSESWNTEANDDNLKVESLLNDYTSGSTRYVCGYLDYETLFNYVKEANYISVFVASKEKEKIDNYLGWFKEQFPKTEIKEQQKVPIEFWYNTSEGPKSHSRNLDVPRWDEVQNNYSSTIIPSINTLMEATEPQGGKLILWSGAPGTGKTYALRALGWEWRKWCTFHYLTEPESFFGHQIAGLMQVILKEDDKDKWRLLVLEDTGEMLVADAKQRVGQNLSRLLNIMDGLLGQGLKVMALITTNEEMGTLHPAILRPGRCWSHINFEKLSRTEANEWLKNQGNDKTVNEAQYLADLYGMTQNWTKKSENKQRVGFI